MKINIITQNEGGSDEPVFATLDAAKAKAKYLELIKTEGNTETDPNNIAAFDEPKTDDDGIERTNCGDLDYVRIDDVWYEMRDSYGDTIVRWFVLDVE